MNLSTNNGLAELGIEFDMTSMLLSGLKTALPFIAAAVLIGGVVGRKGLLGKLAFPFAAILLALYCFI